MKKITLLTLLICCSFGYTQNTITPQQAQQYKQAPLPNQQLQPQEEDYGFLKRWTGHLNLGGAFGSGSKQFLIGGSVGYYWASWTHSILNLNYVITNNDNYLGGVFRQRLYYPMGPQFGFTPFLQGSYGINDFSDSKTSYLAAGLGVQLKMGQIFFYDIYFHHVWRETFDANQTDGWNFGLGGGIRF